MPESSDNLTVSVVVPVYNGAEIIEDCIEALLCQVFTPGQFEIIIVNNRSTDGTQEIIDRYPVRSLYESKRGPAAARNAGIRASTAKFVAFTDADCIPHNDWLAKLISSMTDSVCGAGGQIVSYYQDDVVSSFIDQIVFRQRYNILQKSPPHITTANACYRRTSLEKIGLFDESFPFAAGEDRDLGERLAIAGETFVFAEDAIVRHKHPQTLEGFYQQRFRHASGQFYASLKKHRKISFSQMLKEIDSGRLINLGFRVVFCNSSKQEKFRRWLQFIDSAAYTNGLIWRYLMYLCWNNFSHSRRQQKEKL
ncbi:MAG: glycosyltransferase [Trichloromonas sp.]|jgi:glycosyltransferase involved in cell wall biosynthesis|nr:glycosyltransferase [Trichloromonas sp.]